MRTKTDSILLPTITIGLLLAVAPAFAATGQATAKANARAAQTMITVKPTVLPYAYQAVSNANTLRPVAPALDSSEQLDQIRSYVPRNISDAPNYAEEYQSELEMNAKDNYEREHGEHIDKIIRGNPNIKRLALTFDDGPHAKYTLELLSELKNLHVQATFFVVGKQVVKFPTLVQLEVIEGNEVGNHTYDHVNLTKIPPAMVPYELDQCDAVLRHILGTSPRFFRPPGGDYDPDVIRAAAAHGYITTLWTEDPGDYARLPATLILSRLLARLKPGAIILLHDGIPQTMQMLPEFVAEARRQGYQFVTMSQLAAERQPEAQLAAERSPLR